MTKPLDLTRPITTRHGRKTGGWSVGPDGRLYGWMTSESGRTHTAVRQRDGRLYGSQRDDKYDLINPTEKWRMLIWANVYEYKTDGTPRLSCHKSRTVADENARAGRIACIGRTIEFEIGEGLDDE